MVQLSPDAHFGQLVPLSQAVDRLSHLLADIWDNAEPQPVPLAQAHDRILARDLDAEQPVPRFANSAVDGFAFRHSDLGTADPAEASASTTTRLELSDDRLFAGDLEPATLGAMQAMAVTTGAALPTGADSICMLEDAVLAPDDRRAQSVLIPNALRLGDNMRPAGEDFDTGAPIASAGTRLTGRALAAILAASPSLTTLPCCRLPRLAIASTGDELAQGQDAMVVDSNGPMLETLFGSGWKLPVTRLEAPLRDDLESLTEYFKHQSRHSDLILTSGAVSTGDKDYLKAAFEKAGGNINFWRIGIKPGRPVAIGKLGKCVWIGLPGNPVAALVTAVQVALPAIRRGMGERLDRHADTSLRTSSGYWVNLQSPYKKKAGRTEFVRSQVEASVEPGVLPRATKFHKAGAGMISGLTWADGLIEIDSDVTILEPGARVWFTPWEAFRL